MNSTLGRGWLLIAALIATLTLAWIAASLLAAIHFTQQRPTGGRTVRNDFAQPGAPLEWPIAPPGQVQWPSPRQVQEDRLFGIRLFNALASDGGATSHQMMVTQYGWPLPVLQEAQFYWPWDDPRYATAGPPRTGLRVVWASLLVPPLGIAAALAALVGGGAWLVRRRRAKQGRCVACGHPRWGSGALRCSECGHVHEASGSAAGQSVS